MKRISLPYAIVLLSLLLSVAFAQPLPGEDPEQVMEDALGLYLNGQMAEGVRIFQDIAERYRGTDAGYTALNFLANNTSSDQTPVYFQQIISDFPDTVRETEARVQLLGYNFDNDRDKAAFLEGCESILLELGGPTLDEILEQADSPELSGQVVTLGTDTQLRLLEVYPSLHVMLGTRFPDIPGDTANGEAEMQILQFLYGAFTPLNVNYNGIIPIYRTLPSDVQNSLPALPDFVDPEVVFESPLSGSTTGPMPTIEATLTSGDFLKQQIALEKVTATLDGEDITGSLVFRANLGEALQGQTFLTISLSFKPSSSLSAGPHQFVLDVPAHKYPGDGPGKTTAPLSFFVQTGTSDITLPTTQDSTLVERNQHENEGANPLLTLEKIQGKATRSAVSFDLDGVNLNGLTSAKLVLTVDPSESVTGWGNGETVTVSAITTPWVEGNGRHFGLNNNQQDDGSGSGTTWFAAVDTNIDNNSSNSASSWNGASVATLGPTAPALVVTNHFDGQLEFDVTNDILNGNGYDGWLVTKDRENKGSKVSFYAKESGDPTLAPKLILDFGDSTAQVDSPANGVLAKLGLGRGKLESKPSGSELPSFRERLQESPVAAYAGETLVGAMAGPNPALKMASKVAYRAWLEQGLG